MRYSENIIQSAFTLKAALEQLNKLSSLDSMTLFIVDPANKLVGTLTDGDIRRSLIKNSSLEDSVERSMNKNFKYIQVSDIKPNQISELKQKGIGLIPIVDDNFYIQKIIDLNKKKSILPMDAVIMAGGEGKRLNPLTLNTPKPLLNIGNKPIIEYNIDLLEAYCIKNVTISVNYLGQKIKDYFATCPVKDLNINYVEEKEFLGTLGAVSLIKEFTSEYFLVMNSDLLTNIDLEDFYNQLINSKAAMGVATIPYHVSLPYGVIESRDNFVIDIKEKPTYTYYSNAGIYIIHKDLRSEIPMNSFFNATDLIDICLTKKINILNYPILSYWLDIGKHEDYAKAQEDIKHLKF